MAETCGFGNGYDIRTVNLAGNDRLVGDRLICVARQKNMTFLTFTPYAEPGPAHMNFPFNEGKLPFPDGTIIAALHYGHVPPEENNKVFGRPQSFVPGPPTKIQFMAKDARKYASTGGWGFGYFDTTGKPGDETLLKTCFPCHAKASRDFVFTRYAP